MERKWWTLIAVSVATFMTAGSLADRLGRRGRQPRRATSTRLSQEIEREPIEPEGEPIPTRLPRDGPTKGDGADVQDARSGERRETAVRGAPAKAFATAYRMLGSARARRETYVGEWLPEPILTAEDADPARHAEIAESLSVGLLMLLETLSPEERAVFLLREVFEYPHARIAQILGKSDAAVRQLAVKARRRVEEGEPRFETSGEQRDRLAGRFFDAFEEGNLEALEGLLASDVTLHGDGGGRAPALARAVQGRVRVARTMLAFRRAAERFGGVTVRRAEVNGEPGAVAFDPEGKLISVISLEVAGGQIQAVNNIVNPEKLRHLGPVADLRALLAGVRQLGPTTIDPGDR